MSRFKAFSAVGNISVVLFTVVWSSSVLAREETVKLVPSDLQTGGSGFGPAVAIDGDRIVVGAPFNNAAYVFHHDGADWIEEQRITPSISTAGDFFGQSVAIDGDLLVVGAPDWGFPFPDDPGRAFVFRRIGSTWVEEALLISSGSQVGDEFGASVSISGGRVAVGARLEGFASSAVYVFRDDGGNWVEEGRLTPGDAPGGGTAFGWSVSIDGDLLLIGAPGDDSACPGDPLCGSGAAYVYRRSGASWIEEVKLVAADVGRNHAFGRSVSLSGDFALVGASGDDEPANAAGSAYVFENDGRNWTERAKLTGSEVDGGDHFGSSVGIDGTHILVGAPNDEPGGLGNAGSAFLFCRSGNLWPEIDILLASDMATGANIGRSVAVDGRYAVVGRNHGGAYVYDLSNDLPCEIPTLSQWGLCILAMILLVAAKLFFRHKSTSYRSCPTRFTGILAIVAFLSCSDTFAQGPNLTAPHHPEHILVRFKPGTLDETRQLANAAVGATDLVSFAYISGLYLMKVDPKSLDGAIATYLERNDVLYAEPDYELTLGGIPNDPDFGKLWGLHNTGQEIDGLPATPGFPIPDGFGTDDADIDAPEAWDVWTGSADFPIAVLDTGVDYEHEDFFRDADGDGQLDVGEDYNIWVNPGEDLNGNGIVDGQNDCPTPNEDFDCEDNDGNGYVDDLYGYDFGDLDNDPKDYIHHGTHVAGTIGAIGDNELGVIGVTPHCKIVALKMGTSGGAPAFVSQAIKALNYCMAKNILLSNNSWGVGTEYASQALRDTFSRLLSHGHLAIVISHNFGNDIDAPPPQDNAVYPCSYDLPNIICVANTDHEDMLNPTSNFGATSVDLAAPGTNIFSTLSGVFPGDYAYGTGTSFAAPHVTGVAALVMTRYPSLTFDEVRRRILDTVRIPGLPDNPNPLEGKLVTEGIVNAYSALADCNMNGVFDDCELDCNAGGCDQQNCGGASDCNSNSIPDDCDTDCDESGVPDVCESWFPDPPDPAPSGVEEGFIKNRYLSFVPTNTEQQTALRVVLASAPSGFEGGLGVRRWVGEPEELSEHAGTRLASAAPGWPTFLGARLQCTPHFMDWSTLGTVHVYDNMIIPDAVYDVQTIHENSTMSDCTAYFPSGYSTALQVSTPKWGDVVGEFEGGVWTAPDGTVRVSDYFTVLDKFQNKPNTPIKSRCDVDPELPNQRITIVDVTRVLDAFRGTPYPFNVPAPCP